MLVLRYTYGKPVLGSLRAKVCRKRFSYTWGRQGGDSGVWVKYNLGVTGSNGGATEVVDVTQFRLDENGYQDVFQVQAELEESGTGKGRRMGSEVAKGDADNVGAYS